MVSSLNCDRWWHLNLVVLKCHKGWAPVKSRFRLRVRAPAMSGGTVHWPVLCRPV